MSTPVSLSKLVDLALGTPEIGAVNFNVLHSLLHAMLKQLNIQDVNTDIASVDRDFLATSSQDKYLTTLGEPDSKTDSKIDSKIDESDSVSSQPKKGRAPYHCLEMKVEKLAQQLDELNALPSNDELFEKAKLERTRYMADMWQYMQLKKRIDANEDGVGKLMSMIEDLMKQMVSLKDANNDLQNKVNNFNTDDLDKRVNDLEKCVLDMDDMKKRLSDLEKYLNDVNDQLSSLPRTEDLLLQFVTWPGLEEALKGVRDEMGNLPTISKIFLEHSMQTDDVTSRPSTAGPLSARSEQEKPPVVPSPRPSSRSISRTSLDSATHSGPSPKLLDVLENLGSLTADHAALRLRVEKLEEEMKNKLDKGALDSLSASNDILEQLHNLMKDIENMQSMRDKDEDAIRRIQEAVLQLQAENEKLQTTAQELIEENQEKAKHIQSLQKQSDSLDELKADKEYVAMEVDVKADKGQLDNKVNQTLFDSTTTDINRIIQEILDKLSGNEDSWKDALKALENDIDGKMDRMELDSLKNWLERRLKALNKKIEQSSGGWTDDDAAGLRKQLLMRFNCLSCDRPVDIMPTGPVASLPAQTPMPPTRSPRPYTTYELDQMRQHPRIYNDSDYYATERQCGGGHTITFPHKRTTRMSHLNAIYREEADAGPPEKGEVNVQGVDGHIYKGRMERMSLEAKLRGSGISQHPKSPSTHQQSGRIVRPMSARSFPLSPHLVQSPRPQSALPGSSRESIDSPRVADHTVRLVPDEADVIDVDVPMTESVAD
ncbi:glutamine-rich protein 2-like [Gigantopelta aegis]|uniref:glutamine-rich protein 2-like n=1 Tax=Gigantopelta aegis TaxID=1735272 RepID=UPI001B88E02E|nr:glutamine-rich protein 2-like [Gigantopelta aegis]